MRVETRFALVNVTASTCDPSGMRPALPRGSGGVGIAHGARLYQKPGLALHRFKLDALGLANIGAHEQEGEQREGRIGAVGY